MLPTGKVFGNVVFKKQTMTASWADFDLGQGVQGVIFYCTEPAKVRIPSTTAEVEIPKEVVIELPWSVQVLQILQGATGGDVWCWGCW